MTYFNIFSPGMKNEQATRKAYREGISRFLCEVFQKEKLKNCWKIPSEVKKFVFIKIFHKNSLCYYKRL